MAHAPRSTTTDSPHKGDYPPLPDSEGSTEIVHIGLSARSVLAQHNAARLQPLGMRVQVVFPPVAFGWPAIATTPSNRSAGRTSSLFSRVGLRGSQLFEAYASRFLLSSDWQY